MSALAPLQGAASLRARLMVSRLYVEPATATEPALYWCYCPRCEEAHPGAHHDLRGQHGLCCGHCGEAFDIPAHALIKHG